MRCDGWRWVLGVFSAICVYLRLRAADGPSSHLKLCIQFGDEQASPDGRTTHQGRARSSRNQGSMQWGYGGILPFVSKKYLAATPVPYPLYPLVQSGGGALEPQIAPVLVSASPRSFFGQR